MSDRTKWENEIKKKLENRKEPVPGFVWEEIEKDLPSRPNLFKRNMNVFRNIAAVFALSAIAVSTFLVTRKGPDTDNKVATIIEQTTNVFPAENYRKTLNDTPSAPWPETPQPTPLTANAGTKLGLNNSTTSRTSLDLQYLQIPEKETIQDTETGKAEVKEENTVNINNEAKGREETGKRDYSPLQKKHSSPDYGQERKSAAHTSRKKEQDKNSKWAVAFEAGNIYNNTGTAQNGVSAREANMMLKTNQVSTYQSMFLTASANESETYTKHHFPVTGAVTVRKYILDRLAVETGLQYTMLRTDMTTGSTVKLTKKQKLQYLGVPLRFSYDIVRIKGFSMYASAGGALEGCVSAKSKKEFLRNGNTIKSETENIEMNRTQWSANAAVGIQFNPIDFMGIYAEPGLTYFFDDGNSISNIRQEHPLNFQLKAGIRFSF